MHWSLSLEMASSPVGMPWERSVLIHLIGEDSDSRKLLVRLIDLQIGPTRSQMRSRKTKHWSSPQMGYPTTSNLVD